MKTHPKIPTDLNLEVWKDINKLITALVGTCCDEGKPDIKPIQQKRFYATSFAEESFMIKVYNLYIDGLTEEQIQTRMRIDAVEIPIEFIGEIIDELNEIYN